MKKTLALLLAIAMIFTLAACGGKSAEDKTSDKSEKKAKVAAVSYTHLTLPTTERV